MSADRQALPVTVASHPGLWRGGPLGPAPHLAPFMATGGGGWKSWALKRPL